MRDSNQAPENNQNNDEPPKPEQNSSESPSTTNESNSPPQQQNQITDDSPKQPDNSLSFNSYQSGISEKSPIPLNEFGLPPSLIPFRPYSNNNYPVGQQNPINLAPYAYNSYPLAFDHFNGYQPNPYLPPFGYYPQPLDFSQLPAAAINHNNRRFSKSGNTPQQQPLPNERQPPSPPQQPPSALPQSPQESTAPAAVIPLDDIKNFANKNKDIPDVPPPPLPSGAKKTSADE